MSKKTITVDYEEYRIMSILSEAFKTINNELKTGITVIDNKGELVYISEINQNTYKHIDGFSIGRNITQSFPNSKLLMLLKNPKNAEKHSIEYLHDRKNVINRFPIINKNNETIGAFSTCKDILYYQEIEMTIRQNLQKKGYVAKFTFDDIIANNKDIKNLINIAKIYSESSFAVLIQGESGTGKELFAQSIHNASSRKNGPFVALNCSTLTENILESELFGYSDASFTGAKKGGKNGLFQEAHNGTLFLDEIGEMPLSFQAKLLRVLQEKEVRPIGSNKIIPIDVRIISATNKNLKEEVDKGNFRLDLWYRLNVLCLNIIPLRKRPEDIKLFNKLFVKKFNDPILNENVETLSYYMQDYSFPGNIRELENILERFIIIYKSTFGEAFENKENIAKFFNDYINEFNIPGNIKPVNNIDKPVKNNTENTSIKDQLKEIEKAEIQDALFYYRGSRTLAAKKLNISISTLRRKIIKYGIN